MLNPIKLKRISLCLITHKHAPALLAVLSEPEVAQYNDYELPLSREDVKQMIQNDLVDHYSLTGIRLAVINNLDNTFMGSVGLYNVLDGQAWLGFELSKRYWNQGYMYEVLKYLVINRAYKTFFNQSITSINAIVEPANLQSNKLLKKLGFIQQQGKIWVHK